MITESKRIPLAFEIETGGLYAERGLEKRTYFFSPEGAGQAFCRALAFLARSLMHAEIGVSPQLPSRR